MRECTFCKRTITAEEDTNISPICRGCREAIIDVLEEEERTRERR